MSFLQKAREKAVEVAKDAADTTTRAAGAVAAKAHDPATQDRLKAGMATAGRSAADVSVKAADASARAATAAVARAQDPATQAKVKEGLASAGRGARTMVERIDPGILADIVIKATALQERANARLRTRGSMYRIGEIQVTASLPPGISFSIERIGDADHEGAARQPLLSSTDLLAGADEGPAEAIVSLDTQEQAAIAEGLADAGAAIDATVEVLEGARPPGSPPPGASPGG